MDSDKTAKRFYRPDELAEIFRLSRRTVYRMIEQGEIKAVRFGDNGPWRVPATEIPTIPDSTTKEIIGRLERPSDTAKRLGISRSSVYRLYNEGKLAGIQVGENTIRIIV